MYHQQAFGVKRLTAQPEDPQSVPEAGNQGPHGQGFGGVFLYGNYFVEPPK